jgi:hypothetical protein
MPSRRPIVLLAGLSLVAAAGWTFVNAVHVGADMTRAANQFISQLDDGQRATVVLEFDTPGRVEWKFTPQDSRKGLQIKEMNPAQRTAAHSLLKSCLSEVGYHKATKIMELEHILLELERGKGGRNIRDTERYYFTVFGQPSEKDRWGLSIEGHHLSLNFVIDGGTVISSTPTFFAANPAIVKNQVPGGQPVGTQVLKEEEELAFSFVNSLNDEQRGKAIIADKAPREIREAEKPQPPTEEPAGLPLTDLSAEQKMALRNLVFSYLDNLPEEVHQQRFEALRSAGPNNIYFAWAGPTEPGIGHYYRVQGPTFLIEFVNTQPDPAGNPANHIHCVWRDMRGDFAVPVGQ